MTDVDTVSYVGQVQGHEEAVPDPEGAPQLAAVPAPLLQSHVSLSPKGEIQTPPKQQVGVVSKISYIYFSWDDDRSNKGEWDTSIE